MSSLFFNPRKIYREYGSNIYFKTKKRVDRIQFRTSIIYAGTYKNQIHIFHLYKHDILINKTKPDEHIHKLAHACNQTLYPLIILCNNKGKAIHVRHDVVWNRWMENRYRINREFIGEIAEKYIQSTEKNISNMENITKLFNKDYFFKIYFSFDYPPFFTNEEKISNYPLIPFENNITCRVTQKLLKLEEDGSRLIERKGIVDDDNFFDYNKVCNEYGKENKGKVNGESVINYTLDANSMVDSIKARFTVRKEDGEPLIKTIMQSYYLSEYPLNPIVDQDSISYAKKLQNSNKKSLWERFNDYINSPL